MFAADLKVRLKNVHTYAVTPFKQDNLLEVDLDAMAGNLRFLIERGVQVIAVCGGTGEIEALTVAELEAVARLALETAGDRALVVPALPGNLAAAVELAPRYEKLGARIALAMPPLIRNQVPGEREGVFAYYGRLSQASDLALMPYNTQAWPAEFFVRLSEIERIIGVKDPCQHPHPFFKAIQLLGDRFVWIGNKRHDPGVLQYRYQAGMEGFTSGFTNFAPEFELRMHAAAQEKDWETIIALQARLAPLEGLRSRFDDAAMVKTAMDLVGLSGGRVRPPRCDVPAEGREAIRKQLAALGVKTVEIC